MAQTMQIRYFDCKTGGATLLKVERLGQVPYQVTWERQKEIVTHIDRARWPDHLLLLEHPHTITLGRSSHREHLLLAEEEYRQRGVEVIESDRGGLITYHGPGQLVGYLLLYLGDRKNSIHQYLRNLEESIMRALQYWGIEGKRKESYTGVWVGDAKVAAIGVKWNRGRIRRGYITSHGFALNVNTDLQYFHFIVPCGIGQYGVTSMEQILQHKVDMNQVMDQMMKAIAEVFSPLHVIC
jgi:lipoyl(octanoyl) transferase